MHNQYHQMNGHRSRTGKPHHAHNQHHHRQLHHTGQQYKQNNGMTSQGSKARIIKLHMALTKLPMKFLITFSLHPQLIQLQLIRCNNHGKQSKRNSRVNNRRKQSTQNKRTYNNRIRYNNQKADLENSTLQQKPPESRRRKHST